MKKAFAEAVRCSSLRTTRSRTILACARCVWIYVHFAHVAFLCNTTMWNGQVVRFLRAVSHNGYLCVFLFRINRMHCMSSLSRFSNPSPYWTNLQHFYNASSGGIPAKATSLNKRFDEQDSGACVINFATFSCHSVQNYYVFQILLGSNVTLSNIFIFSVTFFDSYRQIK